MGRRLADAAENDSKADEMLLKRCAYHGLNFGAMAEAYFDNKLKDASVNIQRRQKTIDAFNRLPEEFTIDDVIRCFSLNNLSAARTRVIRLQKDHLAERVGE